ncbi:hypothetical protein CsSME_00031290 [Camellia sinensis var. sinensis]
MTNCCVIFCEILIAILLPSVGVYIRHGYYGLGFFICLVLTILGYIPRIVYALYPILRVCNNPNM